MGETRETVEAPQDADTLKNTDGKKAEKDHPLSTVDLLRHPVLRRYTLAGYYLMTTCLFIDLGVALNVSTLFGDVYTNAFLTGASEMAANFLVYFGLYYLGRRPSLVTCFVGVVCTESTSVVMTLFDLNLASSVMSIMSRCLASSGYLTLSIYVAELYPTSIRQAALGTANAIGAAIAIAAPLVGGTLPAVWPALPNIIYGGLALAGVPICFLLPETRGQGLPQTLSQSVSLLRNQDSDPVKAKLSVSLPTITKDGNVVEVLPNTPQNTPKLRQPARHTSDLECGVFDNAGNLLYTENASLHDFSFSNIVRLEDETGRPSGLYHVPFVIPLVENSVITRL